MSRRGAQAIASATAAGAGVDGGTAASSACVGGKVKIDATFVRHVDRLADGQAIVSSMLQMATSLGIGTVAEGV